MGAVAFVVLMMAELSLSLLLFGRTIDEHIELYQQWAAIFGLLGQVSFSLFPWIQSLLGRREKNAK